MDATLTPVSIASVFDSDTAWTKDIEMAPGVADLALNKIAETGSGREVAG
jgi:hypothetical protein